jgi:uncharacterized protein (TIGR03435 family)
MKTVIAAATAVLLAQSTTSPRFDVALVKVNHAGGRTTRRIEPQSVTYLNITLGEFIQMAYDVKRYQIDGPDWITNVGSDARYDIVAKSAAPASERQLQAMLAPLLAERFHLAVHRDTRVVPIYALVVGKNGPKLTPSAGDGEPNVSPNPAGGFRYRNYPMGALVAMLSVLRTTGRPILDRTGLTGPFDFTANLQDLPAGTNIDDLKRATFESESTVFTALEEQLGLKLNPDRASIEMLVVDRADRVPTED